MQPVRQMVEHRRCPAQPVVLLPLVRLPAICAPPHYKRFSAGCGTGAEVRFTRRNRHSTSRNHNSTSRNHIPRPGTTIPRAGTIIPRAGTAIPRPGTTIQRPGTTIPRAGMTIPRPGTAIPRPGTITRVRQTGEWRISEFYSRYSFIRAIRIEFFAFRNRFATPGSRAGRGYFKI